MGCKDDGDALVKMMELGMMMMMLSCWADSEAGNARDDDDDGAAPLDIFSKQWMCKGCFSAWMNGTISCEREPGAGQYEAGSTQLPSGSLCRCVNIPRWHRRGFIGVCVL